VVEKGLERSLVSDQQERMVFFTNKPKHCSNLNLPARLLPEVSFHQISDGTQLNQAIRM
jgi:hypothetical protein